MLTSKTLASVDLRLTRPPPQMRPSNENERPSTGDNLKKKTSGDDPNGISPTKKKRREKKNKSPTKESKDGALFDDLSPEAQRRLNAMLRNFCTEDDGA